MVFSKKLKLLTEVYMKTIKVLPFISLLFVAIMLLSVGMIAKEFGNATRYKGLTILDLYRS
jgi:hypothetical protein